MKGRHRQPICFKLAEKMVVRAFNKFYSSHKYDLGPYLLNGRQFHSCGMVRDGAGIAPMRVIIVAGSNDTYLDSTEILDLTKGKK